MDLHHYAAFVLDIDGVLVRDSEPIPGAAEAIRRLTRIGKVVLLTNNSTRTRDSVAERLASLGFPLTADQVVTSACVAAHWLADRHGVQPVWPVGEVGLIEELTSAGHALAGPRDARWVVAGMDRKLTYAKLGGTLTALLGGARFLATNRDATFPTPDGQLPGAGAVVGAIAGMGFPPEEVVGKPSHISFDTALQVAEVAPSEALMIGDRLETDIEGALKAGMDAALVLSGVTTRRDLDGSNIPPTFVSPDLASLVP